MAKDERICPDFNDGNFALHVYRYVLAMQYAYGAEVLDAGCGSGYGAEMLSLVARRVVAVDYDADVVTASSAKYTYRSNLAFEVQDVAELSFPRESFDLIVSFEVYEHLQPAKADRFLGQVARLCRPGGHVILSTPNRLVEGPFMRSTGQSYPYHVNTVSPREFRANLKRHFSDVRLLGQRESGTWFKGALRALDVLNLRHRDFFRAQ